MTVIWFPCGQCHLWAECRREWGMGSNVVTVSGMLVPLLRIAPHCPRLASTPASTGRLHILACENCEFRRVLATTSDVAIVTQFKGGSATGLRECIMPLYSLITAVATQSSLSWMHSKGGLERGFGYGWQAAERVSKAVDYKYRWWEAVHETSFRSRTKYTLLTYSPTLRGRKIQSQRANFQPNWTSMPLKQCHTPSTSMSCIPRGSSRQQLWQSNHPLV